MIKHKELTDPNSCMSRARDDEMTFVLLGRDKAAPAAIRAWVSRRLALGKNALDDEQIREALDCAETMEREHAKERLPKLKYVALEHTVDRKGVVLKVQLSAGGAASSFYGDESAGIVIHKLRAIIDALERIANTPKEP